MRALLACLLAKVHRLQLDIRKPYTEIGTDDSYSGRTYEERYITPFIYRYDLPCNPTTAFLTPAFRTFNQPLEPDARLSGKPREPYDAFISLLQLVQNGLLDAKALLTEVIRQLILLKKEQQQQISLLSQRANARGELSAESIIQIVSQHLESRRSSRLPVLLITAAYDVAQEYLRKRPKPLQPHTAADIRAGTIGDLEIESATDNRLTIVYEMKARRITTADIDRAVQKVTESANKIDQYVIVTTVPVGTVAHEHAKKLSEKFKIEFMILDCFQFIKYFIHLLYELRMNFLNRYEQLLQQEPESAVSHELKRKFLELRASVQPSSGTGDD